MCHPRSLEYMKPFHHLTLEDKLGCSSKKDFMNDVCHSVKIIDFPYFSIRVLREVIVGKSIHI